MNFNNNNNGVVMADSLASNEIKPGEMLRDSFNEDHEFFNKLNYSKHKTGKNKKMF